MAAATTRRRSTKSMETGPRRMAVGDDQAPCLPGLCDGLAAVVEDLHHDGGAVDLVQPWVLDVIINAPVKKIWGGRQANHAAVHRPVDQRLDRGVGKRFLEQPGLVGVEGLAREQQQSHVRVGFARAQDPLGELGHGRHRGEDHAGLKLDNEAPVEVAGVEEVGHQVAGAHAAPGQALGELPAHAFQLAVAVEGDFRVRRGAYTRCFDDAIGLLGCEDLAVAAGVALPEGGVVDDGNAAE
ncbi:hypothetical protein PG997_012608 [Apiospora hydei]|uniref:Uncharacterized protein n=1 Tax=Apiospora hydei TaxID=1337664 RepID=A0ABR1V3U6_9PEZI